MTHISLLTSPLLFTSFPFSLEPLVQNFPESSENPGIREYPCYCLDCQSVIHPLNVESLLNRKAATGSSYGSFCRACRARIFEILKDLEIYLRQISERAPLQLLCHLYLLDFFYKRLFEHKLSYKRYRDKPISIMLCFNHLKWNSSNHKLRNE